MKIIKEKINLFCLLPLILKLFYILLAFNTIIYRRYIISTELFVDFAVFIYFAIIGLIFTVKESNKPYIIYIPVFFTTIIYYIFSYLSWGIYSGKIFNPDPMTISILEIKFIVAILIVLSSFIISMLVYYLKNLAKKIKK